jgi:hypothetical protein
VGKEKAGGWWLRRVGLGTLYDAAASPANVRFEAIEDLNPLGSNRCLFRIAAFARLLSEIKT